MKRAPAIACCDCWPRPKNWRHGVAPNVISSGCRSFSPPVLLRSCWQWAKLGIKGSLAFFVSVFGYGMALGFTVAVFPKPFMPSKIGWWSGPEGFGIIVPDHPELMPEWLGNYFVPVIAAVAFLAAIGTTQILRWMMRKRAPGLAVRRAKFARSGQIQGPPAIKVWS